MSENKKLIKELHHVISLAHKSTVDPALDPIEAGNLITMYIWDAKEILAKLDSK